MYKRLAIIYVCILVAVGFSSTALAGPLRDFEKSNTAIDFNYKPNLDVNVSDKSTNYDFSVTRALDNKHALQYRYTHFHSSPYLVAHQELNLFYKLADNLQVFAGGYTTNNSHKVSGGEVPRHSGFQAGLLGLRDLSKRTYLYGLLSAGTGSAINVEFGLTYKLSKQWEANMTYRHLTVEGIGAANINDNLRGFGFGFTYKY